MHAADVGLFSDGTAVKLVGEETFRLARELVDDFIVGRHRRRLRRASRTCSRTRAASSSRPARSAWPRSSSTSQTHRRKGKTFVAITCGANMNFDRLRFVAERAEVGEEREALFAVTIPEERGSFKRFCELIAARAARHRVQLPHLPTRRRPMSSSASTTADTRRVGQASPRNFVAHGFAAHRPHARRAGQGARAPHGRAAAATLAHDERLLRFVFPERPGRADAAS